MDDFTPEEREYIDRLLEEGREWQRTHGNKQYTLDEVMNEIYRIHEKEGHEYNR